MEKEKKMKNNNNLRNKALQLRDEVGGKRISIVEQYISTFFHTLILFKK